jgi:hypothetical protein
MAKMDELSFSHGQRRGNAGRQLERIVERLTEVDEEQQHLEALMLHLQRRRDQLEREWAELLPVRDRLEAELWEQAVTRMKAEENARVQGPRPPSIAVASVPAAAHEPIDPAPEPWDFADAPEPVPVWVSPVKTWPLPIPGLTTSRSRSTAVARPPRRRATATSASGR